MYPKQNVEATSPGHPCEREYQAVYRAYCFGKFRLIYNNSLIGDSIWRRNKAKSLLKWFLLNPEKLVSADQLIDLFWSDIPSEKALGNLHVTIHHLRHLLEPSLLPRQASSFIYRKPNNFYWFSMGNSWWIDAIHIQHLYGVVQAFDNGANHDKAAFFYQMVASASKPGLLLDDVDEEWLKPYRRYYEQVYNQTLIWLIQFYQKRNELDKVLEYAYQLLLSDPCNELAVKAIAQTYLALGNTTMAIHKLDSFQQSVRQELGVNCSGEFQDLREKIVAMHR